MKIPAGVHTAIITPFDDATYEIDWDSLGELIEFQISQGVSGIVPAGTTGESATLSEHAHRQIIARALLFQDRTFVLSGCGSNSTREAMSYVEYVSERGGNAALLVDPYYNGPSSLEIRKEYYEPIAKAFPELTIIPYIIPGRTGCQLLPLDIAELATDYPNISAVKEATGNIDNMKQIRLLTPRGFKIFSGDDDKTHEMMIRMEISASGVISVVSNIAPATVREMCNALLKGDYIKAGTLRDKLKPLFDIVTVTAERASVAISVSDKFRNPLPIKTAMNLLGMPAGPCRQPLGKMTVNGIEKVRKSLLKVWRESPEILIPIEEFFGVDIEHNLNDNSLWASLCY